MKEAKWLADGTPQAMLRFLKGRTSERKFRLFAVAIQREYDRVEPEFASPESTHAIEKAEAVAESGAPVSNATWRKFGGYFVLNPTGYGAAMRLADISDIPDDFKRTVLHCLFGNPFRPPTSLPRRLSKRILTMATKIYTDRAFDRLPRLAAALESAGCTDSSILDHCRSPGPHTLGCWVVDLILAKK
jgi:hypothetical protein